MNYTATYVNPYVPTRGQKNSIDTHNLERFMVCLHEKFSARQSEKHQSTPQFLSWCTVGTAAKTQTHYRYYTPASSLASSFPHKHTQTHFPSAVLCFLHPSGSQRCEEGKREGGEGRELGRGEGRREARPPCSHGRPECLHCRGSLCNTSGILRPLSPARDGGVVVEGRQEGGEGGGSSKERDLSGREEKRGIEERRGGEGGRGGG